MLVLCMYVCVRVHLGVWYGGALVAGVLAGTLKTTKPKTWLSCAAFFPRFFSSWAEVTPPLLSPLRPFGTYILQA